MAYYIFHMYILPTEYLLSVSTLRLHPLMLLVYIFLMTFCGDITVSNLLAAPYLMTFQIVTTWNGNVFKYSIRSLDNPIPNLNAIQHQILRLFFY